MNSKITYHQQVSYCGKTRCKKCREGIGHGPYWYAYKTTNGHTTRTYIGKDLPPDAQEEHASLVETGFTNPALDLNTVMLRISVLGQFRLEHRNANLQWQPATDAAWQEQHVIRALLALLICTPERKISRARAMEVLWSRTDTETASVNLNKLIARLRIVLEPARRRQSTRSATQLLRTEGDELILADQSRVWVDADAFNELLTAARTLIDDNETADLDFASSHATLAMAEKESFFSSSTLPPVTPLLTHSTGERAREQLLREAAAIYGGDFWPEERQIDWVSAYRQALKRDWLKLMLDLSDLYIRQGATSNAISTLDRLLANDPVNEAGVQRLIVVLAKLNRRGEALRAYHRLSDILQREYKAAPLEETRLLYETIRLGGVLPDASSQPLSATKPLQSGSLSPIGTPSIEVDAVTPIETIEASETTNPSGIGTPFTPLQPHSLSIGRSHQSPLIGRALEVDILGSMLQEIKQNARLQLLGQRRASGIPLDTQRRPQCALLMGEAGIGKTRLAEEVSREAQRNGWSIIWSRVYPQESGIPYRIWTDVLRKVIEQVPGLADPTLRTPALLNPALEALQLQPLTVLLPELSTMLTSGGAAQAGRLHSLPVQEHTASYRVRDTVRELLAAVSEITPLVIVLDDIQWADGNSHELLSHLARALYGYPVFLVVTCRDTELSRQPAHPLLELVRHMQREHAIRTLDVKPLTSEQIGLLVSHLPEPMVQHIQAQAAGNPFFAEELARTTLPVLPRTVAAALEQRMKKLSAPCVQLLGNAAVLGGSFEFSVICAMETDNDLVDEDAVLTLLEEALQSGVITEEGTGTRITYHFWHPLLVSYLYDTLMSVKRNRLHLRAAKVLQRTYRGREEEVAATITHHLIKGGAEAEAIARFAELAADHAYALSAYAEAGYHYRVVIEHSEATVSFSSASDQRTYLIYLLERLAECTMVSGKFEEARRLYKRLLELNKVQPVHSPYEAQRLALLWGEIGWTWRYMADIVRARECCERGEQILREADVVTGPAWGRLRYEQSGLYFVEGRYEEARRSAREALTFFEQPGQAVEATSTVRSTRIQRTLAGNPVDLGQVYAYMGPLASGEGRRTEALNHLKTALTIFEQYDDKRRIAHVSCNLGNVYLKKDDHGQAQAAFRRSLNLAEQLGDDPLKSVIYSNFGELAAMAEDLEEAERWYRKALELTELTHDREYISTWNAALGTVLQEQGKLDEAAICIKQALIVGRASHLNPCIGIALVALGDLRIKQAFDAEATPFLRKHLLKLASHDLQRALSLEGLEAEVRTKGRLALAHIALLDGERERARDELMIVATEAHRYELPHIEAQALNFLDAISRG
jgi:DNA-binding SARP family transcriptional activator/Tfp pilus assembly protein PilF